MLSYNFGSKEEEETARSFFNEVSVIDMHKDVKNVVIALKRKYKIKLPDSIILATALVYSIELLTNDSDLLNFYNRALLDSEIQALYNVMK